MVLKWCHQLKPDKWLPIYQQILEDFGFSREDDEKAAKLMYELGREKLLDSSELRQIIEGRSVAIIGFSIKKQEFLSIGEEVKITAGKALIKVREFFTDFIPEIHVTDMEEGELLLEIGEKCILVLHAHGDNIETIESIIPKIPEFVATTQSTQFDRVYNFGGFTDGDRAACMAKEMNAKVINIYGFDFNNTSGIKKKKLEWAEKILKIEGITGL